MYLCLYLCLYLHLHLYWHLHLHLIPRFIEDSRTPAWSVADHYRAVEQGERAAAPPDAVQDMVKRARQIQGQLSSG